MKKRIYQIELDIKKQKSIDKIKLVQGDLGTNVFEIALKEGEEVYPLDDKICTIVFKKTSGHTVIQSSTDEENPLVIDGNKIICTLKTNSISATGRVSAEVKVSDLSENLLTSQMFQFYVRKSLLSDDVVESTDEFPVLTRLIAQVGELDEILRQNELSRDTTFTTKISDFDQAAKAKLAEIGQTLNEFIGTQSGIIDDKITEINNKIIEVGQILNGYIDDKNIVIDGKITEINNKIIEVGESFDSYIDDKNTVIDGKITEVDNKIIEFGESFDDELGKIESKLDIADSRVTTLNGLISDINGIITDIEEAEEGRVSAEELRVTKFSTFEPRIAEVEQDLDKQKLDYFQQRQLPHFNHAAQEYVNLDQFWNNLRDGKIYTTEFNQYSVSPSPIGIKKDDNANLVMEPSTNTVVGKDDYSKIGLFKPVEVNAYVDKNGDYHVIAIQGDGRFKRDGSMGDVYIMNMTGYTKYVTDDSKWSISYSDTMHAGFEVIQEAIKPDGTIRPYMLHAKYVAGRNPKDGKLSSISGVYAEYVNMSHNGQITEFKAKGGQYSGKTSHDDFYVQLLMWLKYATTHSQSVMKGCEYYYVQYTPSILETDVKRFIVTNAQAGNFLIGSTVSIGNYGAGSINTDRNAVQNHNVVNRVKIIAIEPLGDGLNTAIVLDTSVTFSTTPTATITTYPWNSGGCDKVLGTDGSPYNNLSGKEPFIINSIEMMVGGYEVLQNLIILNNAVDNRIDVYINYDCKTYATSITSAYALAGELVQTSGAWKYGSRISIPKNHPSIILITEAEATSTTGTGDGIYTNPPSAGGTRVWLSLGCLSRGALAGLRCLHAADSLARAYWTFLGRLSATGRSRGELD